MAFARPVSWAASLLISRFSFLRRDVRGFRRRGRLQSRCYLSSELRMQDGEQRRESAVKIGARLLCSGNRHVQFCGFGAIFGKLLIGQSLSLIGPRLHRLCLRQQRFGSRRVFSRRAGAGVKRVFHIAGDVAA
jgi:hypothetical protein